MKGLFSTLFTLFFCFHLSFGTNIGGLKTTYLPNSQNVAVSNSQPLVFKSANSFQKTRIDKTDNNGRPEMVTATILIGVGLVTPAVALASDIDNFSQVVGLGLLAGGVSYLVPTLIQRDMVITQAQGEAALYAINTGVSHAVGLSLLDGNAGNFTQYFTMASILSVGELIAGFHYVRDKKLTPAEVKMYGIMMAYYGPVIGATAPLFSDFTNFTPIGVGVLAGGAAGFFGAKYFTERSNYTDGDVAVFSTITPLVAYSAITYALLNDEFDFEQAQAVFPTSVILGTLGGMFLGDRLAMKHDFTIKQSKNIGLATLAGMAAGLGAVLLFETERYGMYMSTGGLIGFGLGYYYLSSHQVKGPGMGLSSNLSMNTTVINTPGEGMRPGLSLKLTF